MTDPAPDTSNGSDETSAASAALDFPSAFSLDVQQLTALISAYAVSVLDPDGRVVRWNEDAVRLTGYNEDEVTDTHYRLFFPPEKREDGRPERLLEQARTDGQATDEGWRLRNDGSRFWVREVLAPIREREGSLTVGDGGDSQTAPLRGYVRIVHDRTDEYRRELELREEKALTESIFEAQPDLLYAFDTDGNLVQWNERFEQVTGYDPDKLEGMNALEFVVPEDHDQIGAAIERVLVDGDRVAAEARVLTNDGDEIPVEFNSAQVAGTDGIVFGFTGVGRDISDRKARERELERLERLNTTIRTIDETMVTADTQAAVETAVVEAFAAATLYQFAVIGQDEPATGGQQPGEPRSWAGVDATGAADVLSRVLDPPADGPEASPIETESVQCYHSLRESAVDAWRADARERDYGSLAAVPITASGRTFGVLVVAATDATAFTDREREVLQEFGATVGHAFNAMAVRRLLYLDTVVELEFESSDRQDICIDLSAELESDVSLDHVLPLTEGVFVYYITVTGVEPAKIRAFVDDHPKFGERRHIDTSGDESHWEFVVYGPTITGLLADYSARIRTQTVDNGVSNVVVQVSPDIPVRGLVEAVTEAYPDTQLVSKRTVERPIETRGGFRRRVQEKLTDKQQAALEAAYYGGYFEWPTRNSNAGEIAERLDIARQTFHQHLRVAQAKLLTAYFEAGDTSGDERDD
ncbi:bacterio-opsin activator domain-containing protein [Natronorubrum bangense]|uniref:histidine kinase n=2 Tax=Natronorubrum bangense TaxID=61858 RepID=A0A4D6HHF3_9EURY|nr:bacterio-opsin activator domain-containing protein [Natronorubrum bangense]ELY43589.1 PAS/PAC sensor protein [Natronorubrum bangense JCM 10635]QCC53180.1 PAS domain S-box protein [Natronorubrum bangense]QCC56127.1 PAS domain S-box protein [Natronorubrum bangense]